ncbi:MAG: type II toxin-antitoxin system VapC family toxin [Gemmatimonadaceae bacterium]
MLAGSDKGGLLLDTHVWVWLLDDRQELTNPKLWPQLDRAATEGRLFVSDISFWEVALKSAKRQITLAPDAALWLGRAERAPGITYLPLDRAILIGSTRLENFHADPADRVLVTTARLHGLTLVTADAAIIACAGVTPGFSVLDARR